MLAEESHTPSQSIVCKDENNIETINSPGPLKIVNIKSLTNQEREDTEAGDMEVDSITTSSAFKIVSSGSVGKRFLARRLSGCKKSAVKRLSVTDRQGCDMLEKSGKSIITDIEFLGQIIVNISPEIQIQNNDTEEIREIHTPLSRKGVVLTPVCAYLCINNVVTIFKNKKLFSKLPVNLCNIRDVYIYIFGR